MTVNYAQEVATERMGGFFRMLLRWRGSIYKAVASEIAVFLVLYYILNLTYLGLNSHQKIKYAEFCKSCEDFADYIPVTFIVGFYVVRVISRRWTQWENVPWPDEYVFNISGNLHGTDVFSRMLRRTLARFVNLGSILCFRDISIPVKKRFPTLDHLVNAGVMTPEEVKLYEETSCGSDTNWWIPFHWAFMLVEKAKQEDRLDSCQMAKIRDDILDLRRKCWVLFSHDWIPVPMVYTQVVTLAVYMFMLACLFGRQSFGGFPLPTNVTETELKMIVAVKKHAEFYFPFFTVCQVMFYLGWLKVAEILINPMGQDADDFEVNYIIDRNLRVSYTVVDYSYNKLPPVEKDIHWDAEEPDMPHTVASAKAGGTGAFIGSAANVNVSNRQAGISEVEPRKDAANGVLPSRQTSANVPGHVSPVVQTAAHSKSEKHVTDVLRSISRIMSKDNEILDGVKSTSLPVSPATKSKKRKKESEGLRAANADSELALRHFDQRQGSVESAEQQPSRPQSIQQQYSRLKKIDESGEVLIQLLNESENKQRSCGTGDSESIFYLSETPTPIPKSPVENENVDDVDDGRERPRPPLPRQQRNLPCADSPPVPTTKEPPPLL